MFDQKTEGKVSLVRPSGGLEDNIKIDVKYEFGVLTEFVCFKIWTGGGLCEGSKQRLGLQIRRANCLTRKWTVSFSRRTLVLAVT